MADRKEAITGQRLVKLNNIRSHSIDPYPHRYPRTHTIQEAMALFQQQERNNAERPQVRVAGRIVALRSMGKATFIDLRDGSSKIQAYLRRDILGEEKYQHAHDFDIGDIMGVGGKLFRTQR